MNDVDFHQLQIAQFLTFNRRLQEAAAEPGGEALAELAAQGSEFATHTERLAEQGPGWVYRLFTTHPQLAEIFPRDLLWYLGGECLHFMPDDEIELMGNLDEARRAASARGETFDWQAHRAAALGLQ